MGRLWLSIMERLSLRKRRPDLPALRELLDLTQEMRLVDIGGGTGRTTGEFADGPAQAIVLEPEREKLAYGRTRRLGLSFVAGRAESLPFPDASLDRAVGIVSFHHVERPERALDNVLRALRPGGRLVLFELYPDRPGLLPRLFGRCGHENRPHFFEPDRLRTLVESRGFRDVSIRSGVRGYFVVAAK